MAKNEHYVNNKKFTNAVKEWKIEYDKAKAEDREVPEITPFIGDCFYKIAKKYSTRPNFSGYTYKEDMISEAVLVCLKYAHNFNPEKSNNAFAYFTQYCHNAFIQYISKENRFSDFKFEMVKESSSTLGKQDFNDINLYDDEDNQGVAQVERQEQIILDQQIIKEN